MIWLRTHLLRVIGLACITVVAIVATAAGYFTAGGKGSASAATGTLSSPASPVAVNSGKSIAVTWNKASAGSSGAQEYDVERYTGDGTDLGPASCSPVAGGGAASYTCTDSPGQGTFEYKITAVYQSWTTTSGFTNTASTTTSTTSLVTSGTPSHAGQQVTYTATVALTPPATPTGTVQFLDGGTTITGCGSQSLTDTAPYTATCSVTYSTVGSHSITATYSDDANAFGSTSSALNQQVNKAAPALTAAAPASGVAGLAISAAAISANLSSSSGSNATGTVTFYVIQQPAMPMSGCGGPSWTQVATATVNNGNASYNPSSGLMPSNAGTYWWYASYDGDPNNSAAASTCGSDMSSTVVSAASPTLTAQAPATGMAGTTISASAISGALSSTSGSNAAGTVTFYVLQQSAAPTSGCGGASWTQVGTASVSGNGTYQSNASYTPTNAGDYWWYASYGGDSNNAVASSTCGAGMAETVVAKASPSLISSDPSTATVDTTISASAISGALSSTSGSNAAGTVTFYVLQQSAAPTSGCGGASWTQVGTASVSGNGTYQSNASYTPSAAGSYWWYASYGGDANNATASSTCGPAMAETAVKASPTLTAGGPATATVNTAISASSITAALASGSNATGTVTFYVLQQSAAPTSGCGGSGWTTVGTASVSGNGPYNPSASYTPTAAGNYWWYAAYGGDSNNAAASSTCGTGMAETTAYANNTVSSTSAGTYTVTVPAHVTSLTFTLTGAGGADTGGAGGFLSGMMALPDSETATTLTVIIGGGGSSTGTAVSGGTGCAAGGAGGNAGASSPGGGGGGATCVYVTSATPIAVAGGGGGGSGSGSAGGAGSGGNSGTSGSGSGKDGGGGGSSSPLTGGTAGTAGNGSHPVAGAVGGTLGGAGGSGGAGPNGGGGGGGGYASGGGGGGGNNQDGGGGGGSGYSGGASGITVSNVSTTGTGGTGGGAGSSGGAGSVSFTGLGITES